MSPTHDHIKARSDGALTVQQVIDLLSAIEDKTLPVWADGCDCTNPVIGIATRTELGVQIEVAP